MRISFCYLLFGHQIWVKKYYQWAKSLEFSEGASLNCMYVDTYICRCVLGKVERNAINKTFVKSKFVLFLDLSDFYETLRCVTEVLAQTISPTTIF